MLIVGSETLGSSADVEVVREGKRGKGVYSTGMSEALRRHVELMYLQGCVVLQTHIMIFESCLRKLFK